MLGTVTIEAPTGWEAKAEAWLSSDLSLLTEDRGWLEVSADLWKRRTADDPNAMFRWRLDLAAPADVVFEVFVRRIVEYHQHFTKELVSARQVLSLRAGAQIVHQQFGGAFPFRPRDLCHLNVEKDLGDGRLLCTHRSVDTVSVAPGHVRMLWWGATLCVPGATPETSVLWYLDQENARGLIRPWLLDRLMGSKFMPEHRARIARFFANGGPPEVRKALGHPERKP